MRENKIWKRRIDDLLPVFGHRNWIVVADSAYPAQANAGIETIATGEDHFVVLKAVPKEIARSRHIRAKAYLDSELALVSEKDAPGVNECRRQFGKVMDGKELTTLPHEQIIHKLDEAGKLFRILLLKSTLTIPYTSVFLELDCGYWNPDAEQRLRRSIAEGPTKTK